MLYEEQVDTLSKIVEDRAMLVNTEVLKMIGSIVKKIGKLRPTETQAT